MRPPRNAGIGFQLVTGTIDWWVRIEDAGPVNVGTLRASTCSTAVTLGMIAICIQQCAVLLKFVDSESVRNSIDPSHLVVGERPAI